MLVPLLILVLVRIVNLNEELRKLLYFSASVLILLGIFSMRWNVVIGGQLYSKSFRGLMAYKMEITGIESLVTALALLALPFIILTVLFWLLPPRWMEQNVPAAAH
jgi:predicted membrane protein